MKYPIKTWYSIRNLVLLTLSFVILSSGLAKAQSPWPTSFPKQLTQKQEISFPLSSARGDKELPSLSSEFIKFMDLVTQNCAKEFGISYELQGIRVLGPIMRNASSPELAITCQFPLIINEFLSAGLELQNANSSSQAKTAVFPTVAAAALDFDLLSASKVPQATTRLLFSLRLIKRSWPAVVIGSSKWNNNSQITFLDTSVRQFGPWLTELSSYAALAQYQNQLPCSQQMGDAKCKEVRTKLSRLLQIGILRINATPEIKQFLDLTLPQKITLLPQLQQIHTLNALMGYTFQEGPSELLPWLDGVNWVSPIGAPNSEDQKRENGRGMALIRRLMPDEKVPIINGNQTLEPFIREVVSTVKNDGEFASRIQNASPLLKQEALALHALYIGVKGILTTSSSLSDHKKRFISLKQFLNIQEVSELFKLTSCTECNQALRISELKLTEALISEVAQMARDIKALIQVGTESSTENKTN